MLTCLATIAITAAMIYDGDSTGSPTVNARLTGIGDAPYDTPEINQHAGCPEEHDLGIMARDNLRAAMPGTLCILDWHGGGYGRPLAILTSHDGRDARDIQMEAGLAQPSKTADWCEGGLHD